MPQPNIYAQKAAEEIGRQLLELQEQERILREQQRAGAEAQREAERAAKESSLKYQKWLTIEVQRRTVLGGLSPQLVSEYLSYSERPLRDYVELVQAVLQSPMSGFQITPTGFSFGGDEMKTVAEMQTKLTGLLGRYDDIAVGTGSDRLFHLADGSWLETLLYANLTGHDAPVTAAITENNPLPDGLVGDDARRMFNLTGYHQTLGPLMNSQPKSPDNVTAEELKQMEVA